MARSSKTAQVMGLIRAAGCIAVPEYQRKAEKQSKSNAFSGNEELVPMNAQLYTDAAFARSAAEAEVIQKKKPSRDRRKTVINGAMLTERFTAKHNPALEQPKRELLSEEESFRRTDDEPIAVNIASYLVNEHVLSVARRFNVCTCEKCIYIITQKALQELPIKYVFVEADSDCEKATAELKKMRPIVIKLLTKLAISSKSSEYHKL